MKRDEQLSAWQEEWKSMNHENVLASQLVERAARDSKKLKRAAAVEVLGAALATATVVWLVVRFHGSLEIALVAGAMLVVIGAWLSRYFSVRRDLFRSSGDDVEGFVTLTRRRLAAERLYVRDYRWGYPLLALAAAWQVWMFAMHAEQLTASSWRRVVAVIGIPVTGCVMHAWRIRKLRKLQFEQAAFERSLAD